MAVDVFVSASPSYLRRNIELLYQNATDKDLKAVYISMARRLGAVHFNGMNQTEVAFLIKEGLTKCGFDASHSVISSTNGDVEKMVIPVLWSIYNPTPYVFIDLPETGFSQPGIEFLAEEISRKAQSKRFYINTNSPTLTACLRAMKHKGILSKLDMYTLKDFRDGRYRAVNCEVTGSGRLGNAGAASCLHDAQENAMSTLLFDG